MSQNASGASYHIGLIGCGKMGFAMARAWLEGGLCETLSILDPSPPPLSLPADPARIAFYHEPRAFGQRAQAHGLDMLILAIKPQIVMNVCAELKDAIAPSIPCLSIAAGIPLQRLGEALGSGRPLIRAMPNTPAAIGQGMTVACAGKNALQAHRDTAHALLRALGQIEWITDETLFDAVTALSGSGPAYVFLLMEVMTKAGVQAGLNESFAGKLARQTVIGAAALAADESGMSAAMLRENVTSPNGTTAAALSVLMDGRLQALLTEAIEKAAVRSRELSQ